MDILIVGSIALDTIKTPFGSVTEAVGGSAVYASLSANFFGRVNLVGVVGRDFPPEVLSLLNERGINIEGVQVTDGKTFRWSGYYEYDLNTAHTLDTQLNVFGNFNPVIPETYKNSRLVFLANIDPELQLRILEQVKNPRLTICDTMNYWIETKREKLQEVLEKVNVVIMNDAEIREFSREPNLIKGARSILSLGPQIVIVKKGEHGAILFSREEIFIAPAFPLESVLDPTGAGDTFAGGVVGSLAMMGEINEKNFRKAVIYGTVMASFNVEDFSINRLKCLTLKEINCRYNELKAITSFENA